MCAIFDNSAPIHPGRPYVEHNAAHTEAYWFIII